MTGKGLSDACPDSGKRPFSNVIANPPISSTIPGAEYRLNDYLPNSILNTVFVAYTWILDKCKTVPNKGRQVGGRGAGDNQTHNHTPVFIPSHICELSDKE